jgi:hypothetical protein
MNGIVDEKVKRGSGRSGKVTVAKEQSECFKKVYERTEMTEENQGNETQEWKTKRQRLMNS